MNRTQHTRRSPQRKGVVLICVLVCLLVATTLIALSTASSLRSRREAIAYHQRVQLEQLLGSAAKRAQVAVAEEGADYRGEKWTFTEQEIASPGFATAELSVTVLSQEENRIKLQASAILFAKSAEKTDQTLASMNPPIQKRTIELVVPLSSSGTPRD